MLLSLGMLVLTLGFGVLLSSSTLDALATESILSGYRSYGEHFARSVERGLRFGKPLSAYAGMESMMDELRHGVQGIGRVEVFDARGTLLYVQPDNQPVQNGTMTPAESQAGADDLKQLSGSSGSPSKARKTPTGYRVLIPLQHEPSAGWIALEATGEQVDAATRDFLRWSGVLMLAACIAVGLILSGWLGVLTGTAEARAHLHATLGRLLLIVIGGTQLAYSLGTLVLFDGFVEQAMRTKATILAQSVGRDFEYLIHKGVDVAHLKGNQQLLARLVAENEELRGAELLAPDGTPLVTVGTPAHAPGASGALGLSVETPLDRYWPSRFRQREEVMRLRLSLNPQVITDRVTKLTIDMGTSLVISFLLLLELAKLLGLIARRSLSAEGAPAAAHEDRTGAPNGGQPADKVRPQLPYATQALRAGGFVYFLGYDMGISFIPLLARKLYQPLWGLSEEVIIGLPISAEMISAGVALLISGSFSQRYGWHRAYMLGAAAGAAGLLLGGMATGLPMLILARVTAGFGFGLVLMASQIGTLEHAHAGAGLASVFAGIFSGSICGSAAGAMLAEHLPYESVLTVGGVVTLFAIRAVLFGRDPATTARPAGETATQPHTGTAAAANGMSLFSGGMTLLKDPRMHLMLLLVGIPVAICLTGFLHYLLPLTLANAKVEQSDIGRVFMLYGLCFITAGPLLGKWIDRTTNKPLFLMLAGLLSGVSLLLAATATDLTGTSAAVVALGLSQCIAAPASMLCILALRSAQTLGREKTASIYRALERLGQVAGPVLFGAATVIVGPTQVLLVTGATVCALALIFQMVWRLSTPRN